MSFAQIKPYLIWLHRWIGIVLTPIFIIVLLSGAVLSLRPMLSESAPKSTASATAAVDVSALKSLVTQLEAQGRLNAVTVVDGGRSVEVMSDNRSLAGRWELASATRTGEATAQGFNVFDFAKQLHKSLLLGLGIVVEIATWAMLLIMLAGPFLTWLRFRHSLIGWHIAIGWCLLPITLLAPLTGVLLTLGMSGAARAPLPVAQRPVALAEAITVAAPTVDMTRLDTLRRFRGGTVLVRVAGESAAMFAVNERSAVALTGGPGWVKQIHEGTWGGFWSGLLNLIVSLTLLTLTVTGFYSWLRRWRRDHQAPQVTAGADILVAHASQTGTAARLAQATAHALEAGGEKVVLAPLGTLAPSELARFRLALILASTTGEGAIPDSALRFVKRLHTNMAAGAHFALLGLGDRSYAHFCGGAETLRSALLSAGGTEVVPLARANGDPSVTWSEWLSTLGQRLGLRYSSTSATRAPDSIALRLVERQRLDNPAVGATQETWSIVLESAHALNFRPGDLLRLSPSADATVRSYSIGSSSRLDPQRIELTVRLHQWQDAQGQTQLGQMSTQLIRTLDLGASLSAQLNPHPGFNPPNDPSWPIIMIGIGTGIAPFPGFIAERRASGHAGPAWLLFGNRYRAGDFLWQARWEAALNDGSLTRLDSAFSRDANDGAHIQDRLHASAAELRDWLLEQKAVVYICGRREMANSVCATLASVLASGADYNTEQAQAEIELWIAEGRIRIDAFD